MKEYKWLSILVCFALVVSVLGISADVAYAADTPNVLGGGICLNEILIDPNGTLNFDTDNNGTAETPDEFVELYNLSGLAIDISGWELWDSGTGLWYTFPGSPDDGTTILAAGAYAFVIIGVQTGGSLPAMTNPNSIAYDAARGSGVLNNTGDNVVLYDPGADEYIQLLYNGDAADNPPVDYGGFSTTASLVGSVEDWGSDQEGVSITRFPSGDDNIILHTSTPGLGQASPNAVTLNTLTANSSNGIVALFASVAVLTGAGLIVLRRRKTV